MRTLRAAIGRTPHTAALLDGQVASPLLRLEDAGIAPISRAFAPMVREARFDVSEMAIATFLQARAWGKPLVLLPVVLAARFQEAALLCRADGPIRGPADLEGRRIGVRAYSQTTGMWLRGTLADRFGLRPEAMRWTTFEDAHVPECRDPPWAERAPPGSDMLSMLRDGRLDAAIFGNDTPAGGDLRTVFPDPAAAGEAFRAAHGFTPVNHLLVARRPLLEGDPALGPELVRLFPAAATDRGSLAPALALAVGYCVEQGLLPHPLAAEDIWAGLPSAVA
ncbi:ABC transporter substrate-binding protein [Dankookia rubra]|uniref:ABC transporter substrate-binding protein n=1 Tax=Dankookia rubra TaxID=1442381 RepID=A0A4R5Q8Z5_9PROT|nr:ABC transporter substrate-binding protein [Dankookia rubra]TDH59432.1 ABC transporter substrate-binding protein [Dankookia rubra]